MLSGPARVRGELTVFAAASLTDAFKEIGVAFERANPGAQVAFNFGASSQLRAQLEQGARADVFASADQTQMEAAGRVGALAGPARVLVRNRLTIITPKGSSKGVASVKDLANEGVRIVTTQPNVPIGQYTQAMLERASADPSYGPDFKARVEQNVVSREDNVRQVLAKVQLGEADAALVYTSDVTPQLRDQLRQVAVPAPLNTLATYPVAVARGANTPGGEAFVEYLLAPPGQDILARWGFIKAESGA